MELAGAVSLSLVLRSGVYALVCRGEVMYVGKAKNFLNRLYTHRSQWQAKRKGRTVPSFIPIKGVLFDEIHVWPCALDTIDALEREKINHYKPRLNKVHKNREKITTPITVRVGGRALTLNGFTKPVPERRRCVA